jgi:flagellin
MARIAYGQYCPFNFRMEKTMAFSVNTNAGSLIALQSLNKTNRSLGQVQSRINTGLKVATVKDNAAVYNIAQGLRSDISGLNAARASVDKAISTIDVAISAGEAVGDLLVEMKEKAVAAKEKNMDADSRTALKDEFNQLKAQIATITGNAEFNGINMVKGGGTSVTALLNSDGTSSLSIGAQSMTLGGAIITLSATNLLTNSQTSSLAVTAIDNSLTQLGTAMATLGSGTKRLEIQKDFMTKLSDSITIGIGNLVDADMAKESALLQSLQVKQQLGLQALNIANQAPGAVLSLFG